MKHDKNPFFLRNLKKNGSNFLDLEKWKTNPMFVYEQPFRYFGLKIIVHSKRRNPCSCMNSHFVILEADRVSSEKVGETCVRGRTAIIISFFF
jgi:hypothetical protein